MSQRSFDVEAIAEVFRQEHCRAVATLVRLLGDIESRGGGGPRRLRGSGAEAAGLRSAAQPRRLDHADRSPSGHRSVAPRSYPCRPARPSRPAAPVRRRAGEGTRAGRPAAADLHLLSSGAVHRGADRPDAAAARRAADVRKSLERSSSPTRRWPSAWCEQDARSGTPGSRTGCRPRPSCPTDSARSWRSSTWSSTPGTARQTAMTSSASNSASKRSRNPSLNLTARTLFWDG